MKNETYVFGIIILTILLVGGYFLFDKKDGSGRQNTFNSEDVNVTTSDLKEKIMRSVEKTNVYSLYNALYNAGDYKTKMNFTFINREIFEQFFNGKAPGFNESLFSEPLNKICGKSITPTDALFFGGGGLLLIINANTLEVVCDQYNVSYNIEKCGLNVDLLNITVFKDSKNYTGRAFITGNISNINSFKLFDTSIKYELYGKDWKVLDRGSIEVKERESPTTWTHTTSFDLESSETISFFKEKSDSSWLKPGKIYNVVAYRINIGGQKPDLSYQYCPSIYGYANVVEV